MKLHEISQQNTKISAVNPSVIAWGSGKALRFDLCITAAEDDSHGLVNIPGFVLRDSKLMSPKVVVRGRYVNIIQLPEKVLLAIQEKVIELFAGEFGKEVGFGDGPMHSGWGLNNRPNNESKGE